MSLESQKFKLTLIPLTPSTAYAIYLTLDYTRNCHLCKFVYQGFQVKFEMIMRTAILKTLIEVLIL